MEENSRNHSQLVLIRLDSWRGTRVQDLGSANQWKSRNISFVYETEKARKLLKLSGNALQLQLQPPHCYLICRLCSSNISPGNQKHAQIRTLSYTQKVIYELPCLCSSST